MRIEWHEANHYHRCGMLLHASHYLKILPPPLNQDSKHGLDAGSPADTACDSSAEVQLQSADDVRAGRWARFKPHT